MFKYIFIAFFIAMCSHNYGQEDMGEIHISFNLQCVIEYLCLPVDTWFYSVCSMGNSLISKLMDSSIPDLWAPHSAYKKKPTVSILSGSTGYNFPLSWTLFLHRKNARYGNGQLQMDSQFCLMNHLYCLWQRPKEVNSVLCLLWWAALSASWKDYNRSSLVTKNYFSRCV